MAEYIACKNCDSPYCDGCNLNTLSKMLDSGKFDCIMDEHHTINPAADVVEVRHGYWKQADTTRKGQRFVCSVCNRVSYYPQPTRDKKWVKHCGYSNCPHCLAKMDGKGD